MIPHEREMVEKLKSKPFKLVSLSADDKKDTLTKFLEKEEMPWTHLWNGSAKGNFLEQYQIRFYPTIYVLDAKGVIRFKHVRGAKMDEAVETLLKEMTGAE
jgi:peroxiredoxin